MRLEINTTKPWLLQSVGLFVLRYGGLFIVPPALSCPAYLFFKKDVPKISGIRENTHLFTHAKNSKEWIELPLQIDTYTDKGGFAYYPANHQWMKEKHKDSDRITFNMGQFGKSSDIKDIPCRGKGIYRVTNYLNRKEVAFLTNCYTKKSRKKARSSPVYYQSNRHILNTEFYSYIFNQSNYLLFDQVWLTQMHKREKSVSSMASDIYIYNDLSNFFPITFDSENIESQLENRLVGPVGVNASLSFFARILFLKLKLSLTTDVSFFKDSAHIPMVLFIPMDAKSYLNEESGVFYHWALSKTLKKRAKTIQMPIFTAKVHKLLQHNSAEYAKIGLKYCRPNGFCYFMFKINSTPTFIMQFSLAKKLVQQGFFPIFVNNLKTYEDRMEWGLSEETTSEDSRIGFYFSTSGLSQGNHAWDFWMRLGSKLADDSRCPHPLYIKSLNP